MDGPSTHDLIGRRIGGFEVLSVLGHGGMGVVYRAREIALDRIVALKVLPTALACDESRRERFRREALAAAQLNHPNIVTIYAVALEADSPVIAMEFVDGIHLGEMIRREGKLRPRLAFQLGAQIAGALGAAHSRGVVHRDVKPQNVMVTAEGRAKVLDFGIARFDSGSKDSLTRSGALLGTPAYMAPEHFNGGPIDSSSDIYSLGVVLYQMLSGFLPFQGDTVGEVVRRIVTDAPLSLGEVAPTVPRRAVEIVERCMASDKRKRYSHATELERDLLFLLAEPEEDRGIHDSLTTPINLQILSTLVDQARESVETKRKKWDKRIFIGSIGAVAAGAIAMAFALRGSESPQSPADPPVRDVIAEATPAPTPAIEPVGPPYDPGLVIAATRPEVAHERVEPKAPPKQKQILLTSSSDALRRAIDLYTGIGGTVDEARAKSALSELSEKGDALAKMWVGWFHHWGRCGFARDLDAARELTVAAADAVRRLADKGNADAMFLIGAAYDQRLLSDKDSSAAAPLLERAALAGCTPAMAYLGWIHIEGRGTRADPVRAAQWFLQAAERGDVSGMHNLGWLLADGRGVPRDDIQAVRWFRRGAEMGSPRNMTNLAWMLQQGRGATRNETEALTWIQRAAEAGDDRAMVALAARLESGDGISKDEAAATEWLRRAASLGNDDARKKIADKTAPNAGPGLGR